MTSPRDAHRRVWCATLLYPTPTLPQLHPLCPGYIVKSQKTVRRKDVELEYVGTGWGVGRPCGYYAAEYGRTQRPLQPGA